MLASIFIEFVSSVYSIQLSKKSIDQAKYLFIYNIIIYYLLFVFTKQKSIEVNKQFKLSTISLIISKMYLFIIFLFGSFLNFKYGYVLIQLIDNRVIAHEKYLSIVSGLPLNQIFMTSLIFALILYITKRKSCYFLAPFSLAIFPLFAGSRTYIVIFIFAFVIGYSLNYQHKVKKIVYLLIPLMILLMTMWIFIKNIEITSYMQLFYSILNPFELNQAYFGTTISNDINRVIGFAGNNVTEALFYGGFVMALIYPVLIGSFLSLLINSKIYKNILGFIFLMFILF
jgi:hypothetical protein